MSNRDPQTRTRIRDALSGLERSEVSDLIVEVVHAVESDTARRISDWLRHAGLAHLAEILDAGEWRTPLTGEQLAAKYGFTPHGKDPLTGGPKRKGAGDGSD